MPVRLFIAGASVRAAAQSAVRSGLNVTAADMFCDRDLADVLHGRIRSPTTPRGFSTLPEHIPPAEWMYTGGLENEPELVDAISRRHTLLGHAGSVLRQVRDPWQLAKVLARRSCSFRTLSVNRPRSAPAGGCVKPQRSCGGLRIRWYDPRAAAAPPPASRRAASTTKCRDRIRTRPMPPRLVFSALDPRHVAQRGLPGRRRFCRAAGSHASTGRMPLGRSAPGFATSARSDRWRSTVACARAVSTDRRLPAQTHFRCAGCSASTRSCRAPTCGPSK